MLKNRIEAAKKERVNIRFTLGIGSTAEGIIGVAKSQRVDFIIIALEVCQAKAENQIW